MGLITKKALFAQVANDPDFLYFMQHCPQETIFKVKAQEDNVKADSTVLSDLSLIEVAELFTRVIITTGRRFSQPKYGAAYSLINDFTDQTPEETTEITMEALRRSLTLVGSLCAFREMLVPNNVLLPDFVVEPGMENMWPTGFRFKIRNIKTDKTYVVSALMDDMGNIYKDDLEFDLPKIKVCLYLTLPNMNALQKTITLKKLPAQLQNGLKLEG